MQFEKFPSIPRLFREVIVTEKIDGTNAQINIAENGDVIAGSRNRFITPEDDNFGFARWVKENEAELVEKLGIGQHFGEWYGSGIQRGYGLKEKRFALFNTTRWTGQPLPERVDVVPVLATPSVFNSDLIEDIAVCLRAEGSRIAPGFMNPEGVVVYHTKSRQLYKYTLDGDGHKTVK